MPSVNLGPCSFCGKPVHTNSPYYRIGKTLTHVSCQEEKLELEESEKRKPRPAAAA